MSVADQIKELIKDRENGDDGAQEKIDHLMAKLPKVDTSERDHEMAQFYADNY